MRRALAAATVVALTACGDDLRPEADAGFRSSFDDGTVFFGETSVAAPPAPPMPTGGAEVCVDEACVVSADDGRFVLAGPGGLAEAILTVRLGDLVPSQVATGSSPTGDRNLGGVFLVSPTVVAQTGAAFGVDPALDSRGIIIVLARMFATEPIAVEVDGAITGYLDTSALPDPGRVAMSEAGGAVILGVEPGIAVVRSIAGRCEAVDDGWPGAGPGEVRVPVAAGHVTIVHPYCTGD